jgi:hypothetical protein
MEIPGIEEEHTASSLYPPLEKIWARYKFAAGC